MLGSVHCSLVSFMAWCGEGGAHYCGDIVQDQSVIAMASSLLISSDSEKRMCRVLWWVRLYCCWPSKVHWSPLPVLDGVVTRNAPLRLTSLFLPIWWRPCVPWCGSLYLSNVHRMTAAPLLIFPPAHNTIQYWCSNFIKQNLSDLWLECC